LTRNTYLKRKIARQILHKAEALRYIAEHTTIPVPKVLDVWVPPNQEIPRPPKGISRDDETCRYFFTKAYMVLERVEGTPLSEAKLSEEQTATVALQLREMLGELRLLQQPKTIEGYVASTTGEATFDKRFQDTFFGPFPDEKSFNDWRVSLLDLPALEKVHPPSAEKARTIRREMIDDHRIVFTHGDLQWENIMVQLLGSGPADVRVTGIIDWEMAGWRPEQWEYVKLAGIFAHNPLRMNFVNSILPSYAKECELEKELQIMRGGIFGGW
jgi:aminoglycoside phosphotransferase (APT) family kinase protein